MRHGQAARAGVSAPESLGRGWRTSLSYAGPSLACCSMWKLSLCSACLVDSRAIAPGEEGQDTPRDNNMRYLACAVTGLLVGTAVGRDPRHGRKNTVNDHTIHRRSPSQNKASHHPGPCYGGPCSSTTVIPQNENTTKFLVDGTKIPDVDFDVGESYAGLFPTSSKPNSSELYFWFYPSSNPLAGDEILIWLNGGPGCSSLEGLLQENGPFLWQYGTYKPVKNPYTWVNLTNVVWIDQPAGTGFSPLKDTPVVTDEIEVAEQFLGFWKNFIDTFALHGKKVYITGESYAGYYAPYIADAMHNATEASNNTDYYNVQGILLYAPATSYDVLQVDLPIVPFVDHWAALFSLNQSFIDALHQRADTCGYTDFHNLAMTFPPKGTLPTPPNVAPNPACAIWSDVYDAAQLVNPCFDFYQVTTTCPMLWDVLGFPGSSPYLPEGAQIYFNRTDVQKAINAPIGNWEECIYGILDADPSPPSGLSVLPRVIEKNKKTIIGHGLLDMIFVANGTIMMIQNMTWNGAQGFSVPPTEWDPFFVPYHSELSQSTLAGAGYLGNYHTERGLTFCTVNLAGHMVPQYAPSAAYRHLEFLLGRIESLGEVSDFTTQTGDFGNGYDFTMDDCRNRTPGIG
ncbi:putative peptidase S10 family protein [Teratosphaeria destructans]|uniref:Carboxypeptidase n=1 Tax=Teratosphaeria destructans TaxID=418781 RepID=A0A9W7SKD1_9PEZI|nr:putative peptidase S10 family protein [Teratosphaeria destructans]